MTWSGVFFFFFLMGFYRVSRVLYGVYRAFLWLFRGILGVGGFW